MTQIWHAVTLRSCSYCRAVLQLVGQLYFSIKPQPVILRTVGIVCSFCDCQVWMIAEEKEKEKRWIFPFLQWVWQGLLTERVSVMALDNYADSQKGRQKGGCACVCLLGVRSSFGPSDNRICRWGWRWWQQPFVFDSFLTYHSSIDTPLLHWNTTEEHSGTPIFTPEICFMLFPHLKRSLIFCCDFKLAQASYTPI